VSAGATVVAVGVQVDANPGAAERLTNRAVQARQDAQAPEILDALECPAALDADQLLSWGCGMRRASQAQGRQQGTAQYTADAAQRLAPRHIGAKKLGYFIEPAIHDFFLTKQGCTGNLAR